MKNENLHHILWIDYANETYADDVVGEMTKQFLEHYTSLGNGEILSIEPAMTHITWIDLYNQRFEDERVDDETLESIFDYAKQGFGQVLSVKSLKEEAR